MFIKELKRRLRKQIIYLIQNMTKDKEEKQEVEEEEKQEVKEEAKEEIQSVSDLEYKVAIAKLLNAAVYEFQKHNLLLEDQNKLIKEGMKK